MRPLPPTDPASPHQRHLVRHLASGAQAAALAPKDGTVLLCDLDAFFAAVEILENPHLKDRPVVVGGPRGGRGVVSTCNYVARRYGIRSAMPIAEAERRCPHAVFLPVRHRLYREYARRVFAIYRRFTPWVEPISIDEAFLALGAKGDLATAAAIKRAVKAETGLIVSIGVGPNKFLAKLACELSKPDGLKQITQAEAADLLAPLPVDMIPGIGPKTTAKLNGWGIRTIGQLRAQTPAWFESVFGRRGRTVRALCFGIDRRRVTLERETKSISEETTFDRDLPASALQPQLWELCEEVGRRLRGKGLLARTAGIKVRLPDFVTKVRSQTLATPFADDDTIYATAKALFDALVRELAAERETADPLIRLLGVQVSNLSDRDEPRQMSLFDPRTAQSAAVSRLIDQLSARFGPRALRRGRQVSGQNYA